MNHSHFILRVMQRLGVGASEAYAIRRWLVHLVANEPGMLAYLGRQDRRGRRLFLFLRGQTPWIVVWSDRNGPITILDPALGFLRHGERFHVEPEVIEATLARWVRP